MWSRMPRAVVLALESWLDIFLRYKKPDPTRQRQRCTNNANSDAEQSLTSGRARFRLSLWRWRVVSISSIVPEIRFNSPAPAMHMPHLYGADPLSTISTSFADLSRHYHSNDLALRVRRREWLLNAEVGSSRQRTLSRDARGVALPVWEWIHLRIILIRPTDDHDISSASTCTTTIWRWTRGDHGEKRNEGKMVRALVITRRSPGQPLNALLQGRVESFVKRKWLDDFGNG
ncbi:hypothetical protein EDB19DRAFT_1831789 [Suillus lakei]|nr:hypothetical protein EDB19DRAFT_1831789 [Suillus lakei]